MDTAQLRDPHATAKELGVKRMTLYQMWHRRTLPGYRIGSALMFDVADIEEYKAIQAQYRELQARRKALQRKAVQQAQA